MEDTKQSRIKDREPHPVLAAIAEQLRAAREAKGLSQRALGNRTGLPQSHISQIENAGSDMRTTSLLTLAHALDLELALIPRQLIPALKSLSGEQTGSSRLVTGKVLETLRELTALESQAARILSRLGPEEQSVSDIISILHHTLRELMVIDITSLHAKGIQDRIRHLKNPLGSLKTLLANKDEVKGAANYQQTLSNLIGSVAPIARDLSDLRNRIVHEQSLDEQRRRPVYQLDNGEEDNG